MLDSQSRVIDALVADSLQTAVNSVTDKEVRLALEERIDFFRMRSKCETEPPPVTFAIKTKLSPEAIKAAGEIEQQVIKDIFTQRRSSRFAAFRKEKEARAERISGLFDKANGKTQANLARFCNVTAPAVALWVKHGSFTYDNAVKIANYFGVNPDWLFSGKGDQFAIPAAREVTTDDDRFAIFDVEIRRGENWLKINQPAPVAFNQDYLGSEAIFADTCRLIRVQGDRMAPTIKAGEFLLINEAEKNVISGSVYAVSVNGECLLCQISRIKDGIRLHYTNENYPDEEFTNEMMNNVLIIGRVILSVRQF